MVYSPWHRPAKYRETEGVKDIDIDYQYDRKDDVVRSEADSNGFRNFSKIQTNMGFHAKTIVRDIARVMGYEPSVGNALAK
ncbi:MAG: hypothetical protein J6Y89_08655, partial [Lachnospiraceae bacterium]|nr:hypothetical protein [Lachnospiraceae bacterium]